MEGIPMKESYVGLGVVGTGAIALRSALGHMLPDVTDKVRITAVFDPVKERAQAAADKYGVPAAYGSYDELLADTNVDAVTLCSPIGYHYEQCIKALNAGKHIHSNKTITTAVKELDEIKKLSEEKGRRVVASPGMMLMPWNQRMRRLILDGTVGDVTAAVTGGGGGGDYHLGEPYRHGDDILNNANPSWYFKKPGGGPLYDVTVYFINILTGLLGPAKRVSAFSGRAIESHEFRGETIKNEIDDTTFISIDFGGTLYALCYANTGGDLPGRHGMFTPFILGTKGTLCGAFYNGKPLTYEGDHEPHVTGEHGGLPENHVFEDIMQMVDWVRDGTPSIANLGHARAVIGIIEAAYESAATGKTVELGPSDYVPLPLDQLAVM
jgi:predicted dehydrogenase